MATSEQELRSAIVEIGRIVWERGWVAANDGNFSARLDAGRILATPTNISKGRMRPDDLIICDLEGNKLAGARERTSEILMHLTIYRRRPDVQAVVHAHTPVSTGFAAAGRALNLALLPEVVVSLGCVPLAPYGLPGTPALSGQIEPFVASYNAILLANHGLVTYGDDLWQAYYRMETVEHLARIQLVAELAGGPKLLARDEVQELIAARERYGVRAPGPAAPGCPITAEDPAAPGERITVTREELIALVDAAIAARGL
jgi:L-fuculose-phosphate aldolase